jgi:predicted GTPase
MRRVLIMGAAGRDFHNFNVFFRDNRGFEVVCFTAEQIPNISGRTYPKELAGKLYPKGIPIYPEKDLPNLIRDKNIDEVVLSYSDLSHDYVMQKASLVLACGADFRLMGSKSTMIKSRKPVIAVCAVRTGSGKSQTTRKVCAVLKSLGLKPVAIRHPMPYGQLKDEIWQRFETYEDLIKNKCTIEEIEEYEPLIRNGIVVFAGVDYQRILQEAEKEADVIVWDGGNNDMSFYKPDLLFVVADPLRAGHEISYYPGETNLMMADVVVINKVDTATREQVETVRKNIKAVNPKATIIEAESPIVFDKYLLVKGKKALAIDDGPTVTHGNMPMGAGGFAARKNGIELVDPKPYAVGSIKAAFEKFRHIDHVLPALGYGKEQLKELERTISKVPCDVVIIGTPIALDRYIKINKPIVRVSYDVKERTKPDISDVVKGFCKKIFK